MLYPFYDEHRTAHDMIIQQSKVHNIYSARVEMAPADRFLTFMILNDIKVIKYF